MENAGCGECGVWKMRRKFQFSISISPSNAENQCVNNKNKKEKEKKAMNQCILRCAGLGW